MWAQGVIRPRFNFWFWLLFTCLYRMLPHLSFLLHFFLTYLLPYLSFPLRIDPLCFQAGCRKRRLNVALVFCVVVHFFHWWMCAFVVLGLVFSIPSQEIGLGKCLWNDLFCVEWDVKLRLNQSVNDCDAHSGSLLIALKDVWHFQTVCHYWSVGCSVI